MIHIGANIYYWGEAEQRRLLGNGLRQWVIDARRQSLLTRFWYCCFDARGPHVFALFSGHEDAAVSLRAFLNHEISSFLHSNPSCAAIDPTELQQRHHECRGKFLCDADRQNGVAANNSYALFPHDSLGYPFRLTRDIPDCEELWQSLDAVSFWALDRQPRTLSQAAIRFIGNINRSLDSIGIPQEKYWRIHAASLVPALTMKPDGSPEALRGQLRQAIGDRNLRIFSNLWDTPDETLDQEVDVARIVRRIIPESVLPIDERLRLLREVTHTVLAQLSQPVNLQIPMVLYAWQRSLLN